jgi:hypothetical protein
MIRNYSITLFILLCLVNFGAHGQTYDLNHAINFGSTSTDEAHEIALDNEGNSYLVGEFSGQFNVKVNGSTMSYTSKGGSDIYVTKIDRYGNHVWFVPLGGTGDDVGYDIQVMSSGDIAVIGMFENVVDFDPGLNTLSLTAIGNDEDVFMLKLSKDGNFIWAKHFDGYNCDGLTLDENDNLLFGGSFHRNTDFDPDTSSHFVATSYQSMFVIKIDSSGKFKWVTTFMGQDPTNWRYIQDVIIDQDKRTIAVGTYEGTIDFDPKSTYGSYTSQGYGDGFIIVLDSSGKYDSTYILGSVDDVVIHSLDVNSKNELVLGGTFLAGVDFDVTSKVALEFPPGNSGAFLVKYDHSFALKWVESFGGSGWDEVRNLDIDNNDNIHFAGVFEDIIDIDPDSSASKVASLKSVGHWDMFLAEWSDSASFIRAGSMGGTEDEYTQGIVVANSGIYLTGTQSSVLSDLDPDPTGVHMIKRATNDFDAFMIKVNNCYRDTFYSVNYCDTFVSPSGRHSWTAEGRYLDTLFSGCGGDIHVIEIEKYSDTETRQVLACDSFVAPSGKVWYANGLYKDTVSGASPCGKNQYYWIDLILSQTYVDTLNVTECSQYTTPGGKVYATSGSYIDTIPGKANTCDSIFYINLTIETDSVHQTISACEFFISPSGKKWTTSGVYTDTLTNSRSCDSIIVYDLTINSNSTSTQSVRVCEEFVSPSGKIWYEDGVYKDTIANSHGCDSVITYWLKIEQTFAKIDVNSCGEYTSPSGRYIWDVSGTFYDTLVNSNGCDSLLTINLTVINIDPTVNKDWRRLSAVHTGAKYQWLSCDNNFAPMNGVTTQIIETYVSGSFAVEITDRGCIDTSECVTVDLVNVESPEENNIIVYPNPSSNLVTVQLDKWHATVAYMLCTSTGQKLNERSLTGVNSFDIELKDYTPGIYYLMLNCDGNVAVTRIEKSTVKIE